ncbi:hypothetical protein ACFQBQ_15620 [Granulicella cerasi]|uniref:Uncharacterized protein n=1 Tax=Granulicella cerasi TaxID=741063 RepID=A0ABW1ZC08_9BACT|nr:hypothetical protein [Granulicella cerasi]
MPAHSARFTSILTLAAVAALSVTGLSATAQRHSSFTAPPTAPPAAHEAHAAAPATVNPLAPVSSGLGAIEFYPVNFGVPAPQSLARQLTADDERTRRNALTAMGAPPQYTAKDQPTPAPHSLQVEFAPLGTGSESDALVTVELDHHLVTAVLAPDNGGWHRVATLVFPTGYADPNSTPSTFVRTNRSLLDPTKYRAVFHARENQTDGEYQENEAHMRVLNGHAIITISFVSDAKHCETVTPTHRGRPTCELTHRWLQPEPMVPNGPRRFQLVTATGHLTPKEAEIFIARSRYFESTRLREFTCQQFTFSDLHLRYEPTGPNGPCPTTLVGPQAR